MAKFIGKILVAAVLGLAAAVFAEIKWQWNLVVTFEWVAGTVAVLLVFGLPLRRWLKARGIVRARKCRVAEMEAEWQDLEAKAMANKGVFPAVEIPQEWLNKGEVAYYHAKARMYADDNFDTEVLDGDSCVLPSDKFCSMASKLNVRDWDDYGTVDLIITNTCARVVSNGDLQDLDFDAMCSITPEFGGFVVKGKRDDFEPSFAFEVENGIVASEVMTWARKAFLKKYR